MLLLIALALAMLTLARQRPRWVATCALLAIVCVFADSGSLRRRRWWRRRRFGRHSRAGSYPLTVTATSGPVARTTTVTLYGAVAEASAVENMLAVHRSGAERVQA